MRQADDIRLIQKLLSTLVKNGAISGFPAPFASGVMDNITLRVLRGALRNSNSMKSLNLQNAKLPDAPTLKNLMFKAHFTNSTPVYGRDVHFSLTEALAIAAGFDYMDASTIANANQGVDTNPKTTPVPEVSYGYLKEGDALGIQRRKDWHFTTAQRRAQLKAIFLKSGSLDDLGKYMHAFQDQYSHFGLGPGIGQIGSKVDKNGEATEWSINTEEWHAADYTSSDVDKANKMAEDSFKELGDAAVQFAGKGTITLRYLPIKYSEIKGLVDQFNKAPETPPSEKNRIVDLIRQKAVNYQIQRGPIK
jgi:hypothetical protein